MYMVEKLIDDIVKTNSTNYLTEAGKRFVSNIKNKNDIKKLLADNRDFFINYDFLQEMSQQNEHSNRLL